MNIPIEYKKIMLPLLVAGMVAVAGCSDSDSGGGVAAGQFTINTSGGLGGADGGAGGDADYVYAEKYGNGDVEIKSTGTVNASFTSTTVAGNTGDNPLNVTSDTTIVALASAAARPAAGTPYFVDTGDEVRISNGAGTIDSSLDEVTGIEISAGATLTVELNDTTEGDIDVKNDIINNGTITTVDADAANRGDLQLTVATYWGSGMIDTSGTLDGQNGGDIDIDADLSVINHGDMDSSGADGTAGDAGDGGDIDLNGNGVRLENTGDLNLSGGSAVAGAGGDAGDYDTYSNLSHRNSGDITAMGGSGTTAGGDGGSAYLYADYTGVLLNSANINTSGGDTTGGDGGDADYIEFYTYSPNALYSNGMMTARGGSTTDPAGNGGDGDTFEVYFSDENLDQASDDLAGGDILLSGDIDLRGGDAVATGTGDGGDGGDVYVDHDSEDQSWKERRIAFLGYTDVIARGGDGNQGGDGSGIEMYNYDGSAEDDIDYASGNVTNEADLDGSGGDVSAGATTAPFEAGRGGYVYLETAYYSGEKFPDSQMASNSGDLDLDAGTGSVNLTSTSSARGGYVYMWGYNGASNSGDVSTNGGDDAGNDGGTDGYGGYANDFELYTDAGTASNTGDITANGGAGEYRGGDAFDMYMYGQEISNTGAVVSNGGAADPSLAGSMGGDGAYAELWSPDGNQSVTNTGSIASAPGAGETEGDEEEIRVGDSCTGNCN